MEPGGWVSLPIATHLSRSPTFFLSEDGGFKVPRDRRVLHQNEVGIGISGLPLSLGNIHMESVQPPGLLPETFRKSCVQ